MCICYIIIIIASYMFRVPIVAVVMEVFFEGILHRALKLFTNTKC